LYAVIQIFGIYTRISALKETNFEWFSTPPN